MILIRNISVQCVVINIVLHFVLCYRMERKEWRASEGRVGEHRLVGRVVKFLSEVVYFGRKEGRKYTRKFGSTMG